MKLAWNRCGSKAALPPRQIFPADPEQSLLKAEFPVLPSPPGPSIPDHDAAAGASPGPERSESSQPCPAWRSTQAFSSALQDFLGAGGSAGAASWPRSALPLIVMHLAANSPGRRQPRWI